MLKDVRIPLAPIIPHIKNYLVRSETTPSQFDRELGVPDDTVSVLLRQRNKTIEFNLADKIICAMGGGLHTWRSDPELHRIYQTVDFSQAREYDEATQFPCGHPRNASNQYRQKRRSTKDGRVLEWLTCRVCHLRRKSERLALLDAA